MNQKEKDEMIDVLILISIEHKLGRASIAPDEADLVRRLADKKRLPRAEYVLAHMYLNGNGVTVDKALAMKYLARSSRHGSYDVQIKIAHTYHVIGEYKKIKKCLERALDDYKCI